MLGRLTSKMVIIIIRWRWQFIDHCAVNAIIFLAPISAFDQVLVEVSRRLLVCTLSFVDVLTEYTGSNSEQTRRLVTIMAIRRVKQTSFTRQHHSFPEQGRPFTGLLFYLPSARKAMILMILQPSCRQSSRAVSVSATICRSMATDQMIMKMWLNVCGNRAFHREHLLKLTVQTFFTSLEAFMINCQRTRRGSSRVGQFQNARGSASYTPPTSVHLTSVTDTRRTATIIQNGSWVFLPRSRFA
jgi:hypothetical protein